MKTCMYDLLTLAADEKDWHDPQTPDGMFGEPPMDGNGASRGARNYLLGKDAEVRTNTSRLQVATFYTSYNAACSLIPGGRTVVPRRESSAVRRSAHFHHSFSFHIS